MRARNIRNIIGTGGIGKGQFFLFHTEKELGRNESRMAELSKAKDYCKLHIVFHYIAKLLSPEIRVTPIGMVGRDAGGRELKEMMAAAGADVEWIRESPLRPTMYSVCFQYPDKSGGNITSDNSACMDVTPGYIRQALSHIDVNAETIAVALPEVALESRIELLRFAKEKGALCVASCAAEEMRGFVEAGGPDMCDLIALNQDETAAFAGVSRVNGESDARSAALIILSRYPRLTLWLTYGSRGSLLATEGRMADYPALKGVRVENTGGAGDASLAGLICGYCRGVPLFGEAEGDFKNAGELAVAMAGISVGSADSINEDIDWDYLRLLKRKKGAALFT